MNKKEYSMLEKRLTGKVFDGRGKGVDIYICNVCHCETHTRYVDIGVTPFTIPCANKGCKGIMQHDHTLTEEQYTARYGDELETMEWYRPTYRGYTKQSDFTKQHIENGGLIMRVAEKI